MRSVDVLYLKSTDLRSQGFSWAYKEILSNAGPAFRTILLHLCDLEAGDGILVHCTAGKDRTGVFYAVLLSFLGCSKEDIAADYALTDVGLQKLKSVFTEKIMEKQGLTGEEGRLFAERASSSKPENIIAFLSVLQESWGGAESYIRKECKLDDEHLDKLRSRLVPKKPKV